MKTGTIDIDLNDLDKEHLIQIILFAHERDITFNEAFQKILEMFLDYSKNHEDNINSNL